MSSTAIEKDMVLEGPLWPEPVRVLSVDHYGTMIQVDAVGTRSRQFYPGIIVTAAQVDGLRVVSSAKGIDFSGDPEAFHLAIEAFRIRLAYEYDPHFAVNASTITPLPHQLDAVYRYMLKSPLVRFLLADDPGAGKTIMAGLLLKELRFRGLADRVLVVVPPLVARQWQEELSEKFAEEFTIIDNGVLKANVGRNPWTENDRCITSVYWAARDNVLETLKEADWDLVIADEAHKMAAYRQGIRSQKERKTRLYRLGEELSVRTKHFLLLTATPHKGDAENFRLLLELLDKDLFADRSILEEAMSSQDNPIILRRLKEEMCRFDGTPLFPQRTVKTVAFDLSRAERELYDELTEYVSEHFNKAMQKEKRNVGFAMTILQRRLTSSLAAITASLERRHGRLQDLLEQVRALAATKARQALRDDAGDDAGIDELLAGAEVEDLDDLSETERWDVDAEAPERLWFFRNAVGDGTGRMLSQRLFAVRETNADGAGQFVAAHPLRLHDLVPRTDGASPPSLDDFDARKRGATLFCLEHLVPSFVENASRRRLKERYLERSFRVVISRHADRLLDMEAKSGTGQDMSLAIGREQRLMEQAKRRQQERLAEVRLEQQLVPRAPEFLGVITVLPHEAAVGVARADDALLAQVRAVESSQGRELDDARAAKLGYDAVARSEDGQDVRFVVARQVDAKGSFWLKASEWSQVQHLADQALLYARQDGTLCTITGQDAAAVATVDDENRRVSIRLAEIQQALPVGSRSAGRKA